MDAQTLIARARDLIADSDRFSRHDMATDLAGERVSPIDASAVRWSGVGAILKVGQHVTSDVHAAAWLALDKAGAVPGEEFPNHIATLNAFERARKSFRPARWFHDPRKVLWTEIGVSLCAVVAFFAGVHMGWWA